MMLEFLADNGGTILVGVVLAAVVTAIVVYMRRKKKSGRSPCGCGCSDCPSAGMCHKK